MILYHYGEGRHCALCEDCPEGAECYEYEGDSYGPHKLCSYHVAELRADASWPGI